MHLTDSPCFPNSTKKRERKLQEQTSSVSVRSFVMVTVILLAILFFCGSLSYFIPQGAFETDINNNIIPDTYHMNMEDPEGVVEALAVAGDALQGIHIGGRTRKMPGQDNTDWHRFAAFLRCLGRAIPLCYEPHYLYFEPKRVAGDETYRNAFLSELTRGRDYLSALIEKEI